MAYSYSAGKFPRKICLVWRLFFFSASKQACTILLLYYYSYIPNYGTKSSAYANVVNTNKKPGRDMYKKT